MIDQPCCAPSASRGSVSIDPGPAAVRGHATTDGMVLLEGGEFLMGSEDRFAYPGDGEGPVRRVRVDAFRIDTCAVTNAQFANFVDETGYVTETERFGWSFVFAGLLPDDFPPTRGVVEAPWWRQVERAVWRHPEGPLSGLEGRADHPVVHITWNDAQAFCFWSGKRLPTEAEWEYASRGGLEGRAFPWGDELEPGDEHRMNVWQGTFPSENSRADGFYGTCPVGAFPSNGYGLCNTTGNVWEWCSDWFDAGYYAVSPVEDPHGPPTGTRRVHRGGSYLCHDSYCYRYRVDSRSSNTPDSAAGNVGFRCVVDQL